MLSPLCHVKTHCCSVGSAKAAAGKSDWAHVYLTVLDPLALHDPGQQGLAETALRAACAGGMSRQSTGLRRAGVAQWELRLRMPHGLPAWRVVVSSPTGAAPPTTTIHDNENDADNDSGINDDNNDDNNDDDHRCGEDI